MQFGDPYPSLSSKQLGQAIKAFMSEKCPVCRADKIKVADPLCTSCFDRLPADLQNKISVKEGFIAAFHQALKYLKGESPARSRSTKTG